jgi:hypothetical protein
MCNSAYLKDISGNFNSNINTYLESARHLSSISEIPVNKGVSEFLFGYFSKNVTKTLPFLFW